MLEVSNWNSFDKIRLGSLLPLFKGHDSKCKIKKLIYYFFMFSWNCFHSDLNFYRDLNQATHLSRKLVFAADWRSTEQGTKSHLCFILHSCAGSSVTDIGSPWPWPGPDPGWWRVPRWGRAGPVRTRTSSCPHDAPVESFKSLSEPRLPCIASTGITH